MNGNGPLVVVIALAVIIWVGLANSVSRHDQDRHKLPVAAPITQRIETTASILETNVAGVEFASPGPFFVKTNEWGHVEVFMTAPGKVTIPRLR